MSQYDDYFTHDDKPFAENLNDALLVSNVFDYAVAIELPKMYSDSTWVNSSSERKAGVSIVTVKTFEGLTISTDGTTGDSILTSSASGILELGFYPNFNSFGKIRKISWTSDNDNINVKIKDKNGDTIINSVTNGAVLDNVNLRTLQEFRLLFLFGGADVLRGITVEMENKQQTRYGANVKISSVDGLSDTIDSIEDDISYESGTFTLGGGTVDGYYVNGNTVFVDAETTRLSKRNGDGYSTNLAYAPLKSFSVPCSASWDDNGTTKYGIVMVNARAYNGKLSLSSHNFTDLTSVPTSATLHLHFNYVYKTGE